MQQQDHGYGIRCRSAGSAHPHKRSRRTNGDGTCTSRRVNNGTWLSTGKMANSSGSNSIFCCYYLCCIDPCKLLECGIVIPCVLWLCQYGHVRRTSATSTSNILRDTSPLYSCSLQKVQSHGLHRNVLRHRAPLAPELGCDVRTIDRCLCLHGCWCVASSLVY